MKKKTSGGVVKLCDFGLAYRPSLAAPEGSLAVGEKSVVVVFFVCFIWFFFVQALVGIEVQKCSCEKVLEKFLLLSIFGLSDV